jgi:hypothetical protein
VVSMAPELKIIFPLVTLGLALVVVGHLSDDPPASLGLPVPPPPRYARQAHSLPSSDSGSDSPVSPSTLYAMPELAHSNPTPWPTPRAKPVPTYDASPIKDWQAETQDEGLDENCGTHNDCLVYICHYDADDLVGEHLLTTRRTEAAHLAQHPLDYPDHAWSDPKDVESCHNYGPEPDENEDDSTPIPEATVEATPEASPVNPRSLLFPPYGPYTYPELNRYSPFNYQHEVEE